MFEKVMNLFNSTPGALIVTGILVALYLLYSYIVRPLNRIMKLGDLGFYFGEPKVGKFTATNEIWSRNLQISYNFEFSLHKII